MNINLNRCGDYNISRYTWKVNDNMNLNVKRSLQVLKILQTFRAIACNLIELIFILKIELSTR